MSAKARSSAGSDGMRIGIVGAGLSGLATAFYLQRALPGVELAIFESEPGPGGKQSIKRLEARGGVIVIQKEQTATGEAGIFEMKTNTFKV